MFEPHYHAPPSPTLSAARLTLRMPCMDDVDSIALHANDFEVTRMTGRMPHPYGRADAEAFIGGLAGRDPEEMQPFAIEHEGACVGVLSFFPSEDFGTEVGYWLAKPAWGRGLASEALHAALVWAAEAPERGGWGRRFIFANHFADNPASGAVLDKAGFLYTGRCEPRPSLARGEDFPSRNMVWIA